ncbi:DoxX family protein [Xanthobacter variabilis]|uniref:DoxX family protein n=1 Tax=Xanthobacter variabilis TaxID=3119932 RepID=UPI00374F5373
MAQLPKGATPRAETPKAWAKRALAFAPVRVLALLALTSPYVEGGLAKVLDFAGAQAEMAHFGLEPTAPVAIAVMGVELGGSLLVLTGFQRWLGALALAGFTVMATLLANRFWAATGPERFAAINGFFEHLGLAGAFVLVAWHDLAHGPGQGPGGHRE